MVLECVSAYTVNLSTSFVKIVMCRFLFNTSLSNGEFVQTAPAECLGGMKIPNSMVFPKILAVNNMFMGPWSSAVLHPALRLMIIDDPAWLPGFFEGR